MKNPKQQSERWLKQAGYDLKEAEKCLKDGSYAYACFFAEQSAQKSLKSFLIYRGIRFINIHSVGELLKEASRLDNSFLSLIELGQKLDRHYLASRYPDALPEPAIPFESYGELEAKEAIETAQKIFQKVNSLIAT